MSDIDDPTDEDKWGDDLPEEYYDVTSEQYIKSNMCFEKYRRIYNAFITGQIDSERAIVLFNAELEDIENRVKHPNYLDTEH